MRDLRRWLGPALPLGVVACGLLLFAFTQREAERGDIWSTTMLVVNGMGGTATLLAGLAVWLTRPESRLGPVITLMGVAWIPGGLSYSPNHDYVDFVGFPFQGWEDVVLIALVLLFPTGRLGSRGARVVLAGVVLSHLALGLARLLLRTPLDPTSCFCVPNRILPITDPKVYDTADRIASVSEALFALAALAIVVAGWQRASGPARRTLGWVAAAGAVAAAIVVYNRLNTRLLGDFLQSSPTMQIVLNLARMSIPIAAAAVLVRGRRARARVADLVVDVSAHGLLDSRAQLSRALADPSVQLLRYRPQDGTYRDEQHTAVTPPEGATPLEAAGVRLGLLVHDPALHEEPELLASVVAAARLALHNERLADEVRAQLDEVRKSRRRLVEVADEERRRLERDLHDGAQQYLAALNLQAGAAARRAERLGDDQLSAHLRELAEHASSALNELRSLASGIRPPVLTDLGLAGALEELAERFPVPVTLELDVAGRLDDVIEATAYFVAAEGMTNVVKYAEASRARLSAKSAGDVLELRISDDGRGGATPGGGSGLLGLRDRLEALGGTLTVESPLGHGTTLVARIPLATADQPSDVARR